MVLQKKLFKNIFYISFVVLIICKLQKDKLPDQAEILPELERQPLQTETLAAPFIVEKKGIAYRLVPLYDYELWGLVVTYHHSSVWWDTDHKDDFANTKDICLIWGENIKTQFYKRMKFSSGAWTCYYELPPGSWGYTKFKGSCLSNNHVIPADEKINRLMLSAEKGDQVYIKGYLVDYTQDKWGSFKRRSSTIRTDNLCEIIYVTDFKILKKANLFWRFLYKAAQYSLIFSIAVLLYMFFRYPIRLDQV